MIKIILIGVSAILFGLVITYSWFNRDSDRVVLTLLTVMTIGAFGFIAKELISNKIERISKEIPVAVFYGLPDYRPLNIKLPYSFDLNLCIQNIAQKEIPKNNNDTVDIEFASKIYFDAVQYIFIKTLFERFGRSWFVNAKRTRGSSGDSLSRQHVPEKGKEILIADILKYIPDNYFVKLGMYKNLTEPFGGKAIFPPSTDIKVETNPRGQQTKMMFATTYISLNITMSMSSSTIGLGEYSRMMGLSPVIDRNDPQSGKYGNSVFLIELIAEQNFWLNGHPEMKKHRIWAESIINLLDSHFNYESIREGHLKLFQLYGSDALQYIQLK